MPEPLPPFLPVTRHSDWGYRDHLDGKPIVDGEWIQVLWPDQLCSTSRAKVEKNQIDASDMGKPIKIHDDRAFVEFLVRGVLPRFYLRRDGVTARRIPAP